MLEIDEGWLDFSGSGGAEYCELYVEVGRRCTGVVGVDEDNGVNIARDGWEDVLEEIGDGAVEFEDSIELELGTSTELKRRVREGAYD